MFSVIIPLYNKADHIEKAIRSVLNQSFHAFELIIVNDGSTDEGLAVVENYISTQIRSGNNSLIENCRIINQPNSGVSVARNNGIKEAKYPYIAFLDADDWWHKHYLAKQKTLIENYPEAGLYGSSYFQIKRGKQIKANIGLDDSFLRGYINYFEVYRHTLCMPIWTSATVIPKRVFNELVGFNPGLKLGEDFDLWVRIALQNKIAYLNEPLAYYNHDVEITYKASALGRIYKPEEHYIFQLDYLSLEEKNNSSLKRLLDALRVYVLLPYYLNTTTRNAARKELQKVDWTLQPGKERIRYRMPILILKIESYMMQWGSKIKQFIRKMR